MTLRCISHQELTRFEPGSAFKILDNVERSQYAAVMWLNLGPMIERNANLSSGQINKISGYGSIRTLIIREEHSDQTGLA